MSTGQGLKRLWELRWARSKADNTLDVKLSSGVVA